MNNPRKTPVEFDNVSNRVRTETEPSAALDGIARQRPRRDRGRNRPRSSGGATNCSLDVQTGQIPCVDGLSGFRQMPLAAPAFKRVNPLARGIGARCMWRAELWDAPQGSCRMTWRRVPRWNVCRWWFQQFGLTAVAHSGCTIGRLGWNWRMLPKRDAIGTGRGAA